MKNCTLIIMVLFIQMGLEAQWVDNGSSITTNDNVGIGTTNPGERFQIGNVFAFHDGGDDYLAFRSSYSDFGQSGWNYLEDGKSAFAISGVGNIHFRIASGTGKVRGDVISWLIPMTITTDGNIGINTTLPDAKLAVNGNIHAKEVKVDLVGWPDYVFKKGYDLPTLEEVEMHIKEKGHLINIPSAKEVEENGIELGEMNMKLLEKIEELTLYIIELKVNSEKEISLLKTEIEKLKKK
ncbi:hypothetical protein SAMN04487891_1203 [Flagellimonas taeanensis]|uniref:Chaperone of endosialidase n=1 Tax=Flagellimonas taeanensis TaxID=1005926 RepID=A0A1M7CY20_9FLAO|nr:hypothetical protein [Allomuricauda taeanensis]SFC66629.1 hypothetical protein SAMN04487891_1203 [Allomuricauda taeanensis]SHL72142.1 hypothetical protein SAMN05216293_4141 [Allomuricauda taeanensis]